MSHHVGQLPFRPRHGHKGLFGRVLVVGGCDEMIGAPALAARASLRCGSGLVQIATPARVLAATLTICPEATGLGLGVRSDRRLLAAIGAADVIVVGPGLGMSESARKRVRLVVGGEKPTVIDADALNLLADERNPWGKMKTRAVLTPHPGEMRRLIGRPIPEGDAARREIALEFAMQTNQVVVLKGGRTVIAGPDGSIQINTTGDSSLSKAGTGDVLAGVISSLIGQGMPLFDAASLGVYLHGLAGESAGRRWGRRSVLASDVIDTLPEVIRKFERKTKTFRSTSA
jgi:hydroxyethylthiazole kinase-like uncharacterized protein yjeF